MFVDNQKMTYSEVREYEQNLFKKGFREVSNFWDIDDLAFQVKSNIKNKKYPFFCNFNGKFIIVGKEENISEDDIYKFICGKTKEEKELADKRWIEEHHKKEEEWKNKVPTLVDGYIEKGHKLLNQKYWNIWDKCVPIRLSDLYHGMELDCVLELIKLEKENASFDEIKKALDNQGHSGMSYSLVRVMYRELSDKGKEYFNWSKQNDF